MGEKPFIQNDKPSRQRPQRASRLHGPRPTHFDSDQPLKRRARHDSSDNRERPSVERADRVFEEVLEVSPEVGLNFTDASQPGEMFEIERILPNGNLVVSQTSSADGNGGNYAVKRTWNAREMREIADQEVETGTKRLFVFTLNESDIDEIHELMEELPNTSDAVPETAISDMPDDVTLPKPGRVKGKQFGGVTPGESIATVFSGQGPEGDMDSNNEATRAIDAQVPNRRRRRGRGTQNLPKTDDQDVGTIESPSVTTPPAAGSISAVTPEETSSVVNNGTIDPMSSPEQFPVPVARTQEHDSRVLTGVVEPSETSGANTQPLWKGEEIEDVDFVEVERPIKNGQEDGKGSDDRYADGSVWVEEYLQEADRAAAVKEASDREPSPAIVRTRNHPLHSRNTDGRSSERGGEAEGAEDGDETVLGSEEEKRIFAAFGRRPDGESLSDEERETTPEGKLKLRIKVLTSACDQARLEYVTADNESRTMMSRLKGVLGISGKGIQNETLVQKKEAYQAQLRELRDLRLELVKLKHSEQTESKTDVSEPGGEDLIDFPAFEEGFSLEKELEAELRHFAQEVNIGLYNAWTELRSEQKGIIGKLKQFGESYNKLSWQKKLVIGIPVAGLAVASGAGLLGTAMASAAIAAVIARRGVAAAGMFATVDGGLQKLAESRAQKMAEKIVAQGRQEAASLEVLAQGEAGEGGIAEGEAQASPEADAESLDVKLERMKTFMDNHLIDSLDQTLESRVRGQDRRRLGALAGSMGVAFGLPSFMASETGHDLTRAATEKVGKAASWVGETVFGDDYTPAKPDVVPTGETGVAEEAAGRSSSSDIPARAATGSALEQSASAKMAESAGGISGILGKEITLVKGDSVWKLAGNMAKELGVKGEAEKLYFTDALKDAYLARGGDPNIKAGAVFDWKKYLSAEDIQKALEATNSLTPEQKASILANKGKSIAVAIGSSGLVAESPIWIMDGEVTKYPEILAQAKAQVSGSPISVSGVTVGENNGAVRPSTTVEFVNEGKYNQYRIDGVRPDQLVNTTELPLATAEQISKIRFEDFTRLYALSKVSTSGTLEFNGMVVSADGVHRLGQFFEGAGKKMVTQALESNSHITLGELLRMQELANGGMVEVSHNVTDVAGVEAASQGQGISEIPRVAGGGAEGFLKVVDTDWKGGTPTVDLIKIDQVRPIIAKVPNMTCQEFFQVYLDAKDSVSNHYDQIDTLTFQGGLNWAEVDTFAHFINGFRDPDSGRNLIVQAVRANPNITLKEFVEMYAPQAETVAPLVNEVIGETSSAAGSAELNISGGAQTGVETGPGPFVESASETQSVRPIVEGEVPIGSEPEASDTSQPVEPEEQPAPITGATMLASQEVVRPESVGGSVETTGIGSQSGAESGISIEQGNGGEALAFSQHVEPNAEESFRKVSYEPSDTPSQRNGIVRGPAPRTGMPPAGGFESNPKIPGIGPINLMELQFAEQKLQFGPASKLTLRQLAESTKDPSKIPAGLTPKDIAKIKRLLARVPGTNTGTFILQNGDMTVRQFIQDSIRVRLPRPGSTSI